jgi:hypothetical protein
MRHMINDRHWPTDGEWKESVLRSIIRRSAPSNVSIGRGFVVTGRGCSTQIDILIHDNSHPVLYRDGDLVFVTPAACRAIIEVKSRLDVRGLDKASRHLATAANFIRGGSGGSRAFVGLFSYEATAMQPERATTCLVDAAAGSQRRVIDHVVLGPDRFVKWWNLTPERPRRTLQSWHMYDLHAMAAGYFVHNLLLHLSPSADQHHDSVWFPEQSKEAHLVHRRPLLP